MKKWGAIVTLLYAFVLVGLLTPIFVLIVQSPPRPSSFVELLRAWEYWLVPGFFILCQAVLLSINVDTSQKRSRSRTPIVITAAITGALLMIVTVVVVFATIVSFTGEKNFPDLQPAAVFTTIGAIWLVWGILFYLFYRNSPDPVTRALAWLFRGSVLELLVAVPTHVIVRRREDCCAPAVTGFGITSGIAIMLLAFGPSVVLLFKKRLEGYKVQGSGTGGQSSEV